MVWDYYVTTVTGVFNRKLQRKCDPYVRSLCGSVGNIFKKN